MKHRFSHKKLVLGVAAAMLFPAAANAAAKPQTPAGEGVPVSITVTAEMKHGKGEVPNLAKEDFLVYQGKERRPVLSAVLQTGANDKLDFYVLVDEAIDDRVSLNYKDVKAFISGLPASARVGVLYALNGSANPGVPLTTDHEAAIKGLRLPLGRIAEGGGVYLALEDLAKNFPVEPGRRRVVLLLSSGIDLYRGYSDTWATVNPDLSTAIDYLNRNGVVAYSIYVDPAGHFARSMFLVTNGQSCLSRLGDEAGGEAYFVGLGTPVDFQPMLEDLGRHLNHQYLVTFRAKPRKKAGLENLRVTTEASGVEMRGPAQVYVPAEK
jgi:hypothetical protein